LALLLVKAVFMTIAGAIARAIVGPTTWPTVSLGRCRYGVLKSC
jgi:hypothetical protein